MARWTLPLVCLTLIMPDQPLQGASLFLAIVSLYTAILSHGNPSFSLSPQDQLMKLS